MYLLQRQHLHDPSELCRSGAEVPAGDLEGSAKDLGANKVRHDDLGGRSSSRGRSYPAEGCTVVQLHGQNSNLIVVAAVADGPTPGLPSVPGKA